MIGTLLTKRDALVLRHLLQRPDLEAERRDGAMNPLLDLLREARVVDDLPGTRVGLGCSVRYIDDDTGTSETVTLVLPQNARPRAGRISVLSPLGSALLGRAAGERVLVERPGGRASEVTIVDVELPEDDAESEDEP